MWLGTHDVRDSILGTFWLATNNRCSRTVLTMFSVLLSTAAFTCQIRGDVALVKDVVGPKVVCRLSRASTSLRILRRTHLLSRCVSIQTASEETRSFPLRTPRTMTGFACDRCVYGVRSTFKRTLRIAFLSLRLADVRACASAGTTVA